MRDADTCFLAGLDQARAAKVGSAIEAQPNCGISDEMDQSCGTNSQYYRFFVPREIGTIIGDLTGDPRPSLEELYPSHAESCR